MKPAHAAPVLVFFCFTHAATADTRYVDPDAPGSGSGLDWEHAYTDLQQALDAAAADSSIDEVRVAGGELYRPTVETVPGDPRSACFVIPGGLSVLGGFAGYGAPQPDLRAPHVAAVSLLSGDLLLNDLGAGCSGEYGGQADNAYRIVDLSGSAPGTVFDGFALSHGVADGPPPFDRGAAMFIESGEGRVSNCRFYANYAAGNGGAVYRSLGSGRFEDCEFRWNEAGGDGGALWSTGAPDLLVLRCSFKNNEAGGNGGAVYSTVGRTEAVGCEFFECDAGGQGGAIHGSAPEVLVIGCSFAGCTATAGNCVYSEGAVAVGNSAMQGPGGFGGFLGAGPDTFLHSETADVTVEYTCAKGFLYPGPGNLDADPLFADASASACTPDLSLLPGSPCIDAGNNAHQQQFGPLDLRRLTRYVDDPAAADTGVGSGPLADMGAIEHQPHALGYAWCFGDGRAGADCPCGNTSPPGEGCEHSGGVGMWIDATGTSSVSADDLTVVVRQVPPGNAGLIYSGTEALTAPNVIWDGLQCTLGDTRRYSPRFQTDGVFSDTGFVAQEPSGAYFVPGGTYHFQLWTRDAAAGASPCGTGAVYSPTFRVTMTP